MGSGRRPAATRRRRRPWCWTGRSAAGSSLPSDSACWGTAWRTWSRPTTRSSARTSTRADVADRPPLGDPRAWSATPPGASCSAWSASSLAKAALNYDRRGGRRRRRPGPPGPPALRPVAAGCGGAGPAGLRGVLPGPGPVPAGLRRIRWWHGRSHTCGPVGSPGGPASGPACRRRWPPRSAGRRRRWRPPSGRGPGAAGHQWLALGVATAAVGRVPAGRAGIDPAVPGSPGRVSPGGRVVPGAAGGGGRPRHPGRCGPWRRRSRRRWRRGQWAGLKPRPTAPGSSIVVNTGAGPRPGAAPTTRRSCCPPSCPAPRSSMLDDPSELADELERLAGSGIRALGIAGGDGSINAAAEIALDHRLPAARGAGRHAQPLRPRPRRRDGRRRGRGGAAGTALEVDVGRIDRPPVPQHGQLRQLRRARRRPRGARGPHRQVAGAGRGARPGAAPRDARRRRDRRRARAGVDDLHRQLPLPPGRLGAELARSARRRPARRPARRRRAPLRPPPPGRWRRSPAGWRSPVSTTATGARTLQIRSPGRPLRLARDGETFDGPSSTS